MNEELQEMLDANEELITILCNRIAESKKEWDDVKNETVRLFIFPYSISLINFVISSWVGFTCLISTSAILAARLCRLNRHQKFFAADYQKELDQCYKRREDIKSQMRGY